jgi:hypothetical protein
LATQQVAHLDDKAAALTTEVELEERKLGWFIDQSAKVSLDIAAENTRRAPRPTRIQVDFPTRSVHGLLRRTTREAKFVEQTVPRVPVGARHTVHPDPQRNPERLEIFEVGGVHEPAVLAELKAPPVAPATDVTEPVPISFAPVSQQLTRSPLATIRAALRRALTVDGDGVEHDDRAAAGGSRDERRRGAGVLRLGVVCVDYGDEGEEHRRQKGVDKGRADTMVAR